MFPATQGGGRTGGGGVSGGGETREGGLFGGGLRPRLVRSRKWKVETVKNGCEIDYVSSVKEAGKKVKVKPGNGVYLER